MQLNTLNIENNPIFCENYTNLKNVINNVSSGGRIRLIGLNLDLSTKSELYNFYDILDNFKGIDSNGNNVETAEVSGTVSVQLISPYEVKEAKKRYPYIDIVATGAVSGEAVVVHFMNWNGEEELYADMIMPGDEAIYAIDTIPTKPVEYEDDYSWRYTFNGWGNTIGQTEPSQNATRSYFEKWVYPSFQKDKCYPVTYLDETYDPNNGTVVWTKVGTTSVYDGPDRDWEDTLTISEHIGWSANKEDRIDVPTCRDDIQEPTTLYPVYNRVTKAHLTVYGEEADSRPIRIVSWRYGTNKEIKDMVYGARDGGYNLADYWNIGDKRDVVVNGNSYEFILLDQGKYTTIVKEFPEDEEVFEFNNSFVVGLQYENDNVNEIYSGMNTTLRYVFAKWNTEDSTEERFRLIDPLENQSLSYTKDHPDSVNIIGQLWGYSPVKEEAYVQFYNSDGSTYLQSAVIRKGSEHTVLYGLYNRTFSSGQAILHLFGREKNNAVTDTSQQINLREDNTKLYETTADLSSSTKRYFVSGDKHCIFNNDFMENQADKKLLYNKGTRFPSGGNWTGYTDVHWTFKGGSSAIIGARCIVQNGSNGYGILIGPTANAAMMKICRQRLHGDNPNLNVNPPNTGSAITANAIVYNGIALYYSADPLNATGNWYDNFFNKTIYVTQDQYNLNTNPEGNQMNAYGTVIGLLQQSGFACLETLAQTQSDNMTL